MRVQKLLDDPVDAGEQRRRNFQTKRAGGRQVKDKFKLGRLHHWQVGGLGAPLRIRPSIGADLPMSMSCPRKLAYRVINVQFDEKRINPALSIGSGLGMARHPG